MPEGPEIWRAADTIRNAIEGKEVKSISFAFKELKAYESELKGSIVKQVKPYGKAIVCSFEGGKSLYSHNQLYGKWIIQKAGEYPETNRKLRVDIQTGDQAALLYSASDIEVIPTDAVTEHSYIRKLGPDVVDPETTYDEVLAQFRSTVFRNRKLSSLLLDQGFLSGIGNYLRSEILFCAKVMPDRKPSECSGEELSLLAEYSIELARRSYETKGITTSPDLVEALKREGASRRQYRHYAYGRDGKRCYRCGEIIKVMESGGRKIFYCPEEQN